MKILKVSLIVLVALIGLPLLAAVFMKKDYHVEKSVTVNAPQPVVMENVVNLRKMNQWNPWLKMDPTTAVSYQGPDGAISSSYSWKARESAGTETVTGISADRVVTRVDFTEPVEGQGIASFQFQPEGTGTRVTWTMDGTDPWPLNLMIPFVNSMMNETFEKGLNDLKAQAEGGSATTDAAAQ